MKLEQLYEGSARRPIMEGMDNIINLVNHFTLLGWPTHIAIHKMLDKLAIRDNKDRIAIRRKVVKELETREKQKKEEAARNVPSSFIL